MSSVTPKCIVTVFKRNPTLNFRNINIRSSSRRQFHQESKILHFRYTKSTPLFEHVRSTKVDVRTIYSMSQNKFMPTKDESRELMAVWPDVVRDLTDAGRYSEIPEVTKWLAKVLQYNVPSGKRNRALSLVYAYKSLCPPDELTEENLRLARILGWCTEMLQAFFLVLDDILDQSEVRRNQQCWHLRNGIGLAAINDCTMMEMCIYQLLKKHFKSKDCYVNLVELFLDATFKTGMGQCLDMMSVDSGKKSNLQQFTMSKYNSIVKYKTGYYTFVLPTVAAMCLAGVKDPEMYRQAKTILLEIGHLFQVRDDYLDCYGDTEVLKKSTTDITEGKCCWLIVVALQRATKEQRKILEECYGVADPEKANRVKQLYNELGLPNTYAIYEEETHNLLHTHIQQISRGLPHELFLNLLYRLCPKVGRKD